MILLLSKNKVLSGSFVKDLRQEGFQIETITHNHNLRSYLYSCHDLRIIIIDLESMEQTAASIFRVVKEDPRLKYIPIVGIIRRDLVIEQLIAFELGADDFIYIPYTTVELQLKMRTIQGLLDLQNQLREKEGKIKTLRETQKILVTLSHYINNSLTPLYNQVQFLDENNHDNIRQLKESTTNTIEFIKKVLTSLNNFVQGSEYKVWQENKYRDLLIDIENELEKLNKIHRL